jgi:hypothetical protein
MTATGSSYSRFSLLCKYLETNRTISFPWRVFEKGQEGLSILVVNPGRTAKALMMRLLGYCPFRLPPASGPARRCCTNEFCLLVWRCA